MLTSNPGVRVVSATGIRCRSAARPSIPRSYRIAPDWLLIASQAAAGCDALASWHLA
jgi:hypothetical protein